MTGLKTALVEKFDFSSGTSSRSTKLIHGGVRYLQKAVFNLDIEQVCIVVCASCSKYRIYPKYSDTLNVRTPSFFLKRHLFYVPYISGHVPYRVFLLSVNVRTPKTSPLFLIKLLFFTT